jgi:hypothetical protein
MRQQYVSERRAKLKKFPRSDRRIPSADQRGDATTENIPVIGRFEKPSTAKSVEAAHENAQRHHATFLSMKYIP